MRYYSYPLVSNKLIFCPIKLKMDEHISTSDIGQDACIEKKHDKLINWNCWRKKPDLKNVTVVSQTDKS